MSVRAAAGDKIQGSGRTTFLRLLAAGAAVVSSCALGGCSGSTGSPTGFSTPVLPPANGTNGSIVPPLAPSGRVQDGSQVINGLHVGPGGHWLVKVDSGLCIVGDKPVTVAKGVTLTEAPPAEISVTAEQVVLGDDPPHSYDHGTRLKQLMGDSTPLPGALDPASVHVWSAAAAPRQEYRAGVDYLVDPLWGTFARKPGGAIGENQPVYVDYAVWQLRLDSVVVHLDGSIELKKGAPARTAPQPPTVDAHTFALANLFLDYGCTGITHDDIYPVGPALPAPAPAEVQQSAPAIGHTLTKLKAGGAVTVAFWGDSATAGGTASSPDHAFPALVAAGLESDFQGTHVTVVNAGVGGSDIDQRLPALGKDVLSHHPDLVVVAFVDDMALPEATVKKDYAAAVEQIKAAGADVILTTPHFTMPSLMGLHSPRGKDPRKNVEVIREVAGTEKVGLADVSRQWEHLADEGIPYTTLLSNGVDQPDDRGQQIYARTILSLFPAPPGSGNQAS